MSLKDYYDKPIEKVQFSLNNIDQVKKLQNMIKTDGDTKVTLKLSDNDKDVYFDLQKKRKVDLNLLKSLKKLNISSNIS